MGKLYLGSQYITPIVGSRDVGYTELPNYSVVNGEVVPRGGTLTGDEFKGIVSIRGTIEDGYTYSSIVNYGHCNFSGSVIFPDLERVFEGGLRASFNYCTNITSASFPKLKRIFGENDGADYEYEYNYSMYSCFSGCTNLKTISFPLLEVVGNQGLHSAFEATAIENVEFPSLKTLYTDSMTFCFAYCTSLKTARFPSLDLTGNSSCDRLFLGCTALTDVYFNALKTTSFHPNFNGVFRNMLYNTGTDVVHTIHFPSNTQSKISTLTGYPLFGGTSGYVTIAFDLPATE